MTSKTCASCLEDKPPEAFYALPSKKGRLGSYCKVCVAAVTAEWRLKNTSEERKETARQRTRNWIAKNRERKRETDRRYAERTSAKAVARAKAWASTHPWKGTEKAGKRRASKLQATPSWANAFYIAEAYELCARRTVSTGFLWHVDHVVPLKSATVCGLHVEGNLAVIPAKVNIKKSNRWWPDMPGAVA